MGLFSGLFGKKVGRLAWARFFSESEYEEFTQLTEQVLASHAAPTNIESGTVKLRIDGTVHSVSLLDLARKCHVSDHQLWGELIAEHFDRLVSQSGDALSEELGASFDKATAYLKAQIVPDSFVRPDWVGGENYEPIGAGVNIALVYDLPETVDSVPMKHVRAWQRPLSDLLEIAIANVKKDEAVLELERIELEGISTSNYALTGPSFFVCSHVLWLQEYVDAKSDHGVLFAVPARNAVVFHPIRNSKASEAMKVLALTAKQLHSELPFPISTNVFWSRNGHITSVPFAVDKQGVPIPFVVSDDGAEIKEVTELFQLLAQLPST